MQATSASPSPRSPPAFRITPTRMARGNGSTTHGVSSNFIYTNDVLSNLSGGIKRGTIDQGKLEAQLYIDLEKLAGWKNWTFYANAFGIYNDGRIRRDYVGGMNTIAAIEATPTVRLSELWLERWFGPVSLRFGQLAADAEFFYSDLSQIFLQSDWPTIGAVNLPGGGPAYPLSAVGARIKYEFPKDASLLFAIFNGDPAPPCPNADPDTCNRYGVNFRLSDPAFMIGEFQWRRNRGKDDAGLATTLKFGGWGHLGQFADQAVHQQRHAAGQSGQQWHAADASRRLWNLWRHRSAALSSAGRRRQTAAFPFSIVPRSVLLIAISSMSRSMAELSLPG